jgi:hypothetical protein
MNGTAEAVPEPVIVAPRVTNPARTDVKDFII